MSKTDWYARDTGDYARKTKSLSMLEHGAYTLLLDEYYSTNAPLDANASVLHRVCTAFAPEEQAAVASVLAKFFTLRDGKYHNARADEELARRSAISKKRSKAADARWGNIPDINELPARNPDDKHDASAYANASVLHTTPTPNKELSIKDSPSPQNQPESVDNSGRCLENKYKVNGVGVYDVRNHLDRIDIAQCKTILQGISPKWDFDTLVRVYNTAINTRRRTAPNNAAKAFPKWLKLYTKGKPPD